MTVQLNHTIVHAHDSHASATWLADVLGLAAPVRFGPFEVVETANAVSLDFVDADGEIAPQHYAFLVSEGEFDEIFARICRRKIPHWADPGRTQPGRINHRDAGRGVYFEDSNGHLLEILTRTYGSGG